jgi:L-asparaginase II
MPRLRVRALRGGIEESVHDVDAVVVDVRNRVVASTGEAAKTTPLRSAAKPFQTLPLLEDGAAERFDITSSEIALACASHNSEARQVDIVRGLLARLGFEERDLACGPPPPLARDPAFTSGDGLGDVELALPSPIASNCSGKHTGMLALAKHHGWDATGYHLRDHPVQQRCRRAVAKRCGVPEAEIGQVIDGCGVVCWVLPLHSMARGYADMTGDGDDAARQIVNAMVSHPDLVAGRGRLCTALMQAFPGQVMAKVGAAGVYGAALLQHGFGVALKVADGDPRAAGVALLAILDQHELLPGMRDKLPDYAEPLVMNTRGEAVGKYEAVGGVSFV